MTEEDELLLAQRLGYNYPLPANSPLSQYILPLHPFTVIGPIVIVREVIMDEDGRATYNKRFKPRLRYKLRMLR